MQSDRNPYAVTPSPDITQCTTIESVVSRSPITCVSFDRVQVNLSLSLSRASLRALRRMQYVFSLSGIALDRDVGRLDHIHIISEYDEIFILLFEISKSIEKKYRVERRRKRKNVNILRGRSRGVDAFGF